MIKAEIFGFPPMVSTYLPWFIRKDDGSESERT
jgi:hypothetical protein